MNIHVVFGIIAGLFSLGATIPYIISIVKNKTEPHPVTWWLWAVIGIVTLITYRATGASETIWRAIINFVGPLTVALLSIKYWDGKISRFDWVCFFLSISAVVVWIVSGNAAWGLTLSIVADILAAVPTYVKVWKSPQSESIPSWVINSVGNIFNVLAIRVWMFGVALLPIYLLVLSVSLVVLSLRRFVVKTNKKG